jgi:hypothetical protein
MMLGRRFYTPMPRSKFKPLSLGSLPRVMVAILAMSEEDRTMVATAIHEETQRLTPSPELLIGVNAENMAARFDWVLQVPKDKRLHIYVFVIDQALNKLQQQDAFGTEGQNDPRGDHGD